MLKKLRKRRHIDVIVAKNGWDDILDAALDAADRFYALVSPTPPGADRIKLPRIMPLREMVAHIIDMNTAVGAIIEALGQNKTVSFKIDSFYAGAGKRSWPELLRELQESRDWLEEQASSPVSSLRKTAHHLYGPMSSREWLALIIRHYEYHAAQVHRIMASGSYQSVQQLSAQGNRRTK